jgi:hypothetical protein
LGKSGSDSVAPDFPGYPGGDAHLKIFGASEARCPGKSKHVCSDIYHLETCDREASRVIFGIIDARRGYLRSHKGCSMNHEVMLAVLYGILQLCTHPGNRPRIGLVAAFVQQRKIFMVCCSKHTV